MLYDDRTKGLLIALTAVACVTPDAMLLRWAREEGGGDWQTVFWKLSMMGVLNLMSAIWMAGSPSKLLQSMRGDPLALAGASLLQVCDQLGFTFSFLKTDTARAMLFISLNPVWAALLGWWVLGDRLPCRTVMLLCAGITGSAIAFAPTLLRTPTPLDETAHVPSGHQPQTAEGDVIALATGLCLASYVTFIRYTSKHRPEAGIDAAPSIGNFIAAAIAVPLAGITRGGVAVGVDLHGAYLPVVALNAVFMSCFYVGFTLAPRYIPGAEVALVLLLETLCAPLWVFARFGDVPSPWTICGGLVLLAALICHEALAALEVGLMKRHE
jgi:drug/metabolite transporter (DMT)-like permease